MSRSLFCALPLLLAACVEDVGTGKTAATVNEPAPAPEAAAPAAPAAPEGGTPAAPVGTAIAIDAARSKIHAVGAKITKKHDIDFDRWTGELRVDGGAVVGLSITVEMASLRADAEKLTGHLQSEDFFHVASFPTATFTSTAVTAAAGADGSTHTVTGDLTLRGTTKSVSFPATIAAADGTISAKTEFTINRQDWGISYPGKPDDLIQDNVVLTVELVAAAPTVPATN